MCCPVFRKCRYWLERTPMPDTGKTGCIDGYVLQREPAQQRVGRESDHCSGSE